MTSTNTLCVNVQHETGNVQPLLNEIRHALDALLEDGETTIIDLLSIPMAPGELDRLEETLGKGEVHAELDALGPSTVRETAIPGVWWVAHRNTEGEIVGRFIEVTRMPAILESQDADITNGIQTLNETLRKLQGGDTGRQADSAAAPV